MSRKSDRPGKQFLLKRRTRGHVLADLSRVRAELVFVEAGYTFTPMIPDYGVDLFVRYYDENGLIEPWMSVIQLKASDRFAHQSESEIRIDLDARDVRHWTRLSWPVFLILFEFESKRLISLDVQDYFSTHGPLEESTRTVRVEVPKIQVVNAAFAGYTSACAEQRFRRFRTG